jgi:hypothetical protein
MRGNALLEAFHLVEERGEGEREGEGEKRKEGKKGWGESGQGDK